MCVYWRITGFTGFFWPLSKHVLPWCDELRRFDASIPVDRLLKSQSRFCPYPAKGHDKKDLLSHFNLNIVPSCCSFPVKTRRGRSVHIRCPLAPSVRWFRGLRLGWTAWRSEKQPLSSLHRGWRQTERCLGPWPQPVPQETPQLLPPPPPPPLLCPQWWRTQAWAEPEGLGCRWGGASPSLCAGKRSHSSERRCNRCTSRLLYGHSSSNTEKKKKQRRISSERHLMAGRHVLSNDELQRWESHSNYSLAKALLLILTICWEIQDRPGVGLGLLVIPNQSLSKVQTSRSCLDFVNTLRFKEKASSEARPAASTWI